MRYKHGFTLLELMITVVIAVIVVTIAIPSFATLMENQRMTTNTNDLIGALKQARSEAVEAGRVGCLSSVCAIRVGGGGRFGVLARQQVDRDGFSTVRMPSSRR